MKLDDLRPRLHLIGLAGIALIQAWNVFEDWQRWREFDAKAVKAKLAQELTFGSIPDTAEALLEEPECTCEPAQLEADIYQADENEWNWKIYMIACTGVGQDYAVGCSGSLDEAREDVLETMQELTGTAGYDLGQVDAHVLHHFCAEVS